MKLLNVFAGIIPTWWRLDVPSTAKPIAGRTARKSRNIVHIIVFCMGFIAIKSHYWHKILNPSDISVEQWWTDIFYSQVISWIAAVCKNVWLRHIKMPFSYKYHDNGPGSLMYLNMVYRKIIQRTILPANIPGRKNDLMYRNTVDIFYWLETSISIWLCRLINE